MRENILFTPEHIQNVVIGTLVKGVRREASSKTERVSGARFSWRGYDYISTIQRRNVGKITAYGSTHELATKNLWDKGKPGFVLKYLHSFEVDDGGERVILESVTSESFDSYDDINEDGETFEARDSIEELHLVRNGMVFSADAVPDAEKHRLARLFNL